MAGSIRIFAARLFDRFGSRAYSIALGQRNDATEAGNEAVAEVWMAVAAEVVKLITLSANS
jgi:hypothetical protein